MKHVRRVLTALPLLAGAALYVAAVQGTFLWGVTKEELELGFFFEFVAIHSVPFLGAFVVFEPKTWRGHIFRWTGVLGLMAMYTLFPYGEAGLKGCLLFWAFAGGMYLGPLLQRDRLRGIGARWLVNVIVYIIVSVVVESATDFNGDNFAEAPVRTQFIFVATLLASFAALEIAGVYDWMLERNPKRKANRKRRKRELEPA